MRDWVVGLFADVLQLLVAIWIFNRSEIPRQLANRAAAHQVRLVQMHTSADKAVTNSLNPCHACFIWAVFWYAH